MSVAIWIRCSSEQCITSQNHSIQESDCNVMPQMRFAGLDNTSAF